MSRVVVADPHVPLVEGGAELHVRALIRELETRGHEVAHVALPFAPQPKAGLLAHATAWRLIELGDFNGKPVDVLIAMRFPSYFAKHPHKVAWVIHQHRAAYELAGTPYSDFQHTTADVGLRKRLIELDTRMFGECRRVFANAGNTAARLRKYNGIPAVPLYHPPPLATRIRPGQYGDYVLSVGRLESIKRPELAVRALAHAPAHVRLVIVGTGSHRPAVHAAAAAAGVSDRVVFAGKTSIDDLLKLYADARAVVYAPYDEDYGYVTLEAFLAHKPVITATDSGGTREFVLHGTNGYVCEPDAKAIGAAIGELASDSARAAALGEAGFERARSITWDGVIERLLN